MKIKKAWETFVAWHTFLELLFLAVLFLGILVASAWGVILRHT